MSSIGGKGVMMIPPYDLDEESYHVLYKTTKRCFESVGAIFKPDMTTVSMGMSGDYPMVQLKRAQH